MSLNNIYILVHPSHRMIKKKMEEIIKEKGFEEAMVNQYDLEETSLRSLLEDVDTISFLTPKKIVIGHHFKYLEGKEEGIEESDIEHLMQYVEHPSDTVLLFLTASKLDNRKKIIKKLKEKNLIDTLEENPTDTIKKNLTGFSYERGVIPLLLEYCKEDQERLIGECEKLKLYNIEEKKITEKMVEELIKKEPEDKDSLAFALVRSIAEKDKKEALKKLEELKDYQMDFTAILGLLESQFRLLYQVAILKKQTYSNEKIAKELEIHPFRVKKTQELLPYYSTTAISRFLKKLEDLDYKVKSGQMESTMLLELLIFNQ